VVKDAEHQIEYSVFFEGMSRKINPQASEKFFATGMMTEKLNVQDINHATPTTFTLVSAPMQVYFLLFVASPSINAHSRFSQ
jgi:hypothetical protein